MNTNPKIYRLMSIFCWIGTAMVLFLEAYMLRMVSKFPEVESFARNTRILGVLLLVWLVVSVWFTLRSRRERKK